MAPGKAKANTKAKQPKPHKGSEQLREFFEQMGQHYQGLTDAEVKEWVGNLLVTAHRLDERCVELTEETWLHQRSEADQLRQDQELLDARQQARRYRAQKINARRDFLAMRMERDLMRVKYDQLMAMLSQGVQLFIEQEAQRTIEARAAIEAAEA